MSQKKFVEKICSTNETVTTRLDCKSVLPRKKDVYLFSFSFTNDEQSNHMSATILFLSLTDNIVLMMLRHETCCKLQRHNFVFIAPIKRAAFNKN